MTLRRREGLRKLTFPQPVSGHSASNTAEPKMSQQCHAIRYMFRCRRAFFVLAPVQWPGAERSEGQADGNRRGKRR
jgi:hypothetical protein